MSQEPGISDATARLCLAVLMWLTVMVIVCGLMFVEIPTGNRDLLMAIGGGIVGALVATSAFYNKIGLEGDRKKDETIRQLADTTAKQAAQAANGTEGIPVAPGDKLTMVGIADGAAKTGSTKPTGKG